MKKTLKLIWGKFVGILTSKRMVALYWHAGTMVTVGLLDIITSELTSWNPDNIITIGAGLVFAQVTKYLNTKDKIKG